MIGKRIREARKTLGFTQKEFAKRLKIGDSSLSKLEKGINNPSSQTIALLCSSFHLNEEWLITGKGEMMNEDYLFIRESLHGDSEELINAIFNITQLPNGWKKLCDIVFDIKSALDEKGDYSSYSSEDYHDLLEKIFRKRISESLSETP